MRYLLEGSVRRAGARVRITVQLIDAVTGGHLWAERYDRDMEDIFAVQDEASAMDTSKPLVGRSTKRPARSRPTNMDAYELCVRARPH